MKKVAYIRWGVFAAATVIGVIAGVLHKDSGRFFFGLFFLTGLVLYYVLEPVIERFLLGPKGAAEVKEVKGIVRESQRLFKRARSKLPPETVEKLRDAIANAQQALFEGQRQAMLKYKNELMKLAEAHLLQFRKADWREYLEPIVFAALVALTLRGFVVEAFEIPSGSMIPSLYVGDKIFVNKLAYGIRVPLLSWRVVEFTLPERGEVVVFKYPKDTSQNFVKRVVALPGDVVEVRDGFVYVNEKPVSSRFLGKKQFWDKHRSGTWFHDVYQLYEEKMDQNIFRIIHDPKQLQNDFGPRRIPEGNIFVMGDNRDNSSDSREWGLVPTENLVGRSMFIWWSQGPGLNTERFFHWVD